MAVIHQFTPVLSYGDAISDYMLELQKFLRQAGHESHIYVERCHPRVAHLCKPFSQYEPLRNPDHTLILHFSIGADINIFVWLSPGKKILIYHNITPHTYFEQVNPLLASQCLLGRYQLSLFRNEIDLALADSEFNRQELEEYGIVPNAEFPIYVSFEKFQKEPLQDILEMYSHYTQRWLFVGRLIPNKRIDALIQSFAVYRKHYEKNAMLIIVGSWNGFERYVRQLKELVRTYGLEDVVLFTGHITLEELVTFYHLATLYISLSEHEGFCVPLLEAMHFRLPILALNRGAVAGTLKGGGALVDELDPHLIAETAHYILTQNHIRTQILSQQEHVLHYYRTYPYEMVFLNFVEMVSHE